MKTELSGEQLAQASAEGHAAPAAAEAPAAEAAVAAGAAETAVAAESHGEASHIATAGAAPASAETHSEVAHGAAGSLPPFLRFDPGVWIWTMVCFVALLLILKKMAWKPILASLEERDKTIKDSLDQAARIQEESKRITEEQNKILSAARSEANAMLQSSKQAAEDLRRKLEQAAQEEKARIIASATAEIDASKRAAMAELKRTTADLSIRIAEKLIQTSLDDTKQRALVDQLINEVSTARS